MVITSRRRLQRDLLARQTSERAPSVGLPPPWTCSHCVCDLFRWRRVRSGVPAIPRRFRGKAGPGKRREATSVGSGNVFHEGVGLLAAVTEREPQGNASSRSSQL